VRWSPGLLGAAVGVALGLASAPALGASTRPVLPSPSQIAHVLASTYGPSGGTCKVGCLRNSFARLGHLDTDKAYGLVWTTSDGATLSAVASTWLGSADGGAELIFFWRNDTFVGTDSPCTSAYPRLAVAPGSIAVTYPTWPKGESFVAFSRKAKRLLGPVVDFRLAGEKLARAGQVAKAYAGCRRSLRVTYAPRK